MTVGASRSRNPLLPLDLHLPDCEARVMPDGRLYLYGSWDQSDSTYCSTQYQVVSTQDFREWTRHGESFNSSQVPWTAEFGLPTHVESATGFDELPDAVRSQLSPETVAAPFEDFVSGLREQIAGMATSERFIYAPDAIEKDGQYYLYFCMSDDSEGVAVSDNPSGPFANPVKIAARGIDPAVFLDDDGQCYYYWGQFTASVARLNPDMRSIDESSIVTGIADVRRHGFHEGSSVRKRNGVYYFVFADESRGKPTCLGYATSASPMGPFVYRGVIIDNDGSDPENWNNHGSIAEFGGQWYVFYHRSSRNTRYMRRVCAEPISFTDDGLIPEVQMTSQGPGEPFAPGEFIPAFTACGLGGTAYIAPRKATECIISSTDGDSATFRYLRNSDALSSVRVATAGTAEIEVWVDGAFVTSIDASPDAQPIDITPGTHEVTFIFRSPTDIEFRGASFW